MKHLILFLLTLFLYNAILGQLTIAATAISAKKPPPVSTSQETKHQDDPNQIEAFCFKPNTSDAIWIAIDGAICANFGTNSNTFPNVVVANGTLNAATTSVINISPGSNYYISDDSNDSNRYYPYSVNIDANAPTSSLWAYYFIPQGSNNDSTVCRDTVTVFFWISSTPCNLNHLILIDVSSGGLNGNGLKANAGEDINSGFEMAPSALALGESGVWSGGGGSWQGNIYTPTLCERANGDTIHAIWTVSDTSCLCGDVDEALLIIPSTPLQIQANGPLAFCVNASPTSLDVPLSSPNYGYVWYKDGIPVFGVFSATYTPVTSGTYTVTVTDAQGYVITSTPIAITVDQLPVADAGPDVTTCANTPVVMLPSTNSGLWTGGTGTWSGFTYTPSPLEANSTIMATWTVTNGACVASDVAIIMVLAAIPSPIITGPTIFCDGEEITLHTPIVGGYTSQWQLNGVDIIGETLDSLVVYESGDYTVIVTSNGCAISSAITNIIELLPPAPTIIANPPPDPITGIVSICANTGTAILSGSAAVEYAWFKNGNFVYYSNTSPNYVVSGPASTDSYTLRVIYTTGGCPSAYSLPLIVAKTQPLASITPSVAPPYCVDSAPILDATPPTGTGYTYSWIGASPTASTTTTATFVPTKSGNHRVIVTDANGCSASSSWMPIIIHPLPNANAGIDKTICTNTTTTIGVNASAGLTYSWIPTINLSNASVANPTLSYTPAGTQTYTLTVTNLTTGCIKTDNVVVTTFAIPATPSLSASASSVCQGATITLTPSGASGTTFWYKNSGLIGSVSSAIPRTISAVTPNIDMYSIRTKSGICLSDFSNAVTVMINVAPTPTLTASPAIVSNVVAVCNPGQTSGTAILTANTPISAPTVSSYNWQQVISGVPTNVVPAANASSYTAAVSLSPSAQNNKIFRAQVTYSNGCIKNSTNVLVKLLPSTCTIRMAQTDNDKDEVFTSYPNPTHNVLHIVIENSKASEGMLVLYNALGEMISNQNISLTDGYYEAEWALQNLPSGLYMLSFQTEMGNKVLKIMKD